MTGIPHLLQRFPFGIWQSVSGKIQLDLNDSFLLTEICAGGRTVARKVRIEKDGDKWVAVCRPDADLLAAQGASSAVAEKLLALDTPPAVLSMSVSDAGVSASWRNPSWAEDEAGNITIVSGDDVPLPLNFMGGEAEYLKVERGQLTFDVEGEEGGPCHSRIISWPGSWSGVTVGRGYDMQFRSRETVIADLTRAGLEPEQAADFAQGAKLAPTRAHQFVASNRDQLGNITLGQQRNLFASVYELYEKDVQAICSKADVVRTYGTVHFDKLDPRIWELIVDLRYRGDYTPHTRRRIQPLVVRSDLAGLRNLMSDRALWHDVDQNRFQKRVQYLS